MPTLLYQPSDRRGFLKTSVLGSALLLGAATRAAERDLGHLGRSLDLALLSDVHIAASSLDSHRGFFPTENLIQAVSQVLSTPVRGVLVNGDVARLKGMRADYEQFKRLVAPVSESLPVLCALGNHDDRSQFRQAVRTVLGCEQAIPDKRAVVFRDEVADILVLDSLNIVNDPSGLLGQAQLAWLASYLSAPSTRPQVIFVHHSLGEGRGHLVDAAAMFGILERHPQVKAVFHGHSHEWKVTRRGRLWLVNLPAVGYNFADDQPVGWVRARFTGSGVTLKLHVIAGNKVADGAVETLPWLG